MPQLAHVALVVRDYDEALAFYVGKLGFALAEDHWKVWRPGSDEVLCRGPVITWASRSPARIASSLLAARALPAILSAAPVVRVGVHPGDAGVPALMASIDRTVARLSRSREAARYAALHR